MEEPSLDADEIQGNSLLGFNKVNQNFMFIQVVDPRRGAAYLEQFVNEITTTEQIWRARKARRDLSGNTALPDDTVWLHMSVTARGLRVFGNSELAGVEEGFDEGIASRGLWGSAIAGEILPLDSVCDVLLVIASDDLESVERVTMLLERHSRAAGLVTLAVSRGRAFHGARAGQEHFGFRDGISQPAPRGRLQMGSEKPFLLPRGSETSDVDSKGRRLVQPGEFVLGYPQESASSSRRASMLLRNGTFLVFVKFKQDVAAFGRFLGDVSSGLSRMLGDENRISAERLGAMIFGRWQDGRPLDFPLSSEILDDTTLNDISFDNDPSGHVCPFASHVRKTYPRNSDLNESHRILRRGIPYGSETSGLEDRGLLFVSYQASIERQFEFILKHWCGDPEFPAEKSGVDPVVGNLLSDIRPFAINVRSPSGDPIEFTINVPRGIIRPEQGGYFFSPSKTGLRQILRGHA